MPTAYTCIIEDNPNVTFRQYLLRCARGFGACIEQRAERRRHWADSVPDWVVHRLLDALDAAEGEKPE